MNPSPFSLVAVLMLQKWASYHYSDIKWHLKSPQPNCLFNRLLRLTTKKTELSTLLTLCEGFRRQSAFNTASYSMLWHYHAFCTHFFRATDVTSVFAQYTISMNNKPWSVYMKLSVDNIWLSSWCEACMGWAQIDKIYQLISITIALNESKQGKLQAIPSCKCISKILDFV